MCVLPQQSQAKMQNFKSFLMKYVFMLHLKKFFSAAAKRNMCISRFTKSFSSKDIQSSWGYCLYTVMYIYQKTNENKPNFTVVFLSGQHKEN